MAKKDTLTPRQIKALESLISGKSVVETAKIANVSRKTIYRWMSEDKFKVEMNRLGGMLLQETTSKMMKLAYSATSALEKILLETSRVPPAVIVQAANVILKQSSDLYQQTNLDQRLAEVEKLLKESEK